MDAHGLTRALEPSSPAGSVLQQKSGAIQGLAQPVRNDGGILAQLLSNPFFTAVSPGLYSFFFRWSTDVCCLLGIRSSWSRDRRCTRAKRPQAWRRSHPSAYARRRRDQCQRRFIPMVSTLDDHISTVTAQRCSVGRNERWGETGNK